MVNLISPTSNQKSLSPLFWYMSTNMIFSADESLTSSSDSLQSNSTCTNFKHSPEDRLIAETS